MTDSKSKFLEALKSQNNVEVVPDFKKVGDMLNKPSDAVRAGVQSMQQGDFKGSWAKAVDQLSAHPDAQAPSWGKIVEQGYGMNPTAAEILGTGIGLLEPRMGPKGAQVENIAQKAGEQEALMLARLKTLYKVDPDRFEQAAIKNPELQGALDKLKNNIKGAVGPIEARPTTLTKLSPNSGFGAIATPDNMAENVGTVVNKAGPASNIGQAIVKEPNTGKILIMDNAGNKIKELDGATTMGDTSGIMSNIAPGIKK